MGAVSDRDVERAVRRVNRRIEGAVVAAATRCLEPAEDWAWEPARDEHRRPLPADAAVDPSAAPSSRHTLIFLHGFNDEPHHWSELSELLVRGVPGGCDVVLPTAVAVLAEEPRSGGEGGRRACVEPRSGRIAGRMAVVPAPERSGVVVGPPHRADPGVGVEVGRPRRPVCPQRQSCVIPMQCKHARAHTDNEQKLESNKR